jgi:hypothetical protein
MAHAATENHFRRDAPNRFAMDPSVLRGLTVTYGDSALNYLLQVTLGALPPQCPALADDWPDDMRLSDFGPGFVCKAFVRRGADIRPQFGRAPMGTYDDG